MIAALTNFTGDQQRFVHKFSQSTINDRDEAESTSSSNKSESSDECVVMEETEYLDQFFENKSVSQRLLKLYMVDHNLRQATDFCQMTPKHCQKQAEEKMKRLFSIRTNVNEVKRQVNGFINPVEVEDKRALSFISRKSLKDMPPQTTKRNQQPRASDSNLVTLKLSSLDPGPRMMHSKTIRESDNESKSVTSSVDECFSESANKD